MAKPIKKVKTAEAGLLLPEIESGRNTRHLRLPATLIGRGPYADLQLSSTTVSLSHAIVSTDGEQFVLSDLGSRTGVRVNDQLVLEISLDDGMDIQIGRHKLQFRVFNGGSISPWGARKHDEPAEGMLTDLMTEQEFELIRAVTCIGSRVEADIRIDDPSVSRAHAVLIRTRAGVVFKDLGSRNGTLINEERVHLCMLETGDELMIGPFSFFFQEKVGEGQWPPSYGTPQPRTTPAAPPDQSIPGLVTRIDDTSHNGHGASAAGEKE